MRKFDAEKREQLKKQQAGDDAMLEPRRLATLGFNTDEIMAQLQSQKVEIDRAAVEELVEEARNKPVGGGPRVLTNEQVGSAAGVMGLRSCAQSKQGSLKAGGSNVTGAHVLMMGRWLPYM